VRVAILIALALTTPARADEPAVPIIVVDADTVEQSGIRWRLDGIDAPEIQQARCGLERERGIKAAGRLMDLVAQRGARLVPTLSRTGRAASGGFGRRLGRLVFLDGTSWADVAIAEGHAVAWTYRLTPARPDWCQVPAS
jgi:endonuclease YncB( thermonuclease family)